MAGALIFESGDLPGNCTETDCFKPRVYWLYLYVVYCPSLLG